MPSPLNVSKSSLKILRILIMVESNVAVYIKSFSSPYSE